MIERALRALPPVQPACRLTVVIPARDEEVCLGATLAALCRQFDGHGKPLPDGMYDIIVFANNCRDGTAALARGRALSSGPRIHVVEDALPPASAHIGTARKYVLDLAAARFLHTGRADGIIASTDSDTIVAPDWIAATLREAAHVDAVAGHVTLDPAEQQRLLAPVRLLYARELTYRRLHAEVEALLDPRPEDPPPRHNSFVGASFAVRAASYVAAGALPPLPRLEDQQFCRALHRIDARIRHSTLVRAATSGRVRPRVDGGFGSFLAHLHECAERGRTFTVDHPRTSLDAFAVRAALRRVWETDDVSALAAFGTVRTRADALRERAAATTFGAFAERATAALQLPVYPQVGVDEAIDALRAALAHGIVPESAGASAGLPA